MPEDLIRELVTKKILISDRNRLTLFNRVNISMYGAKAWAFTLQKLALKRSKDYLYDLGKIMGKDSAMELKDTLKGLSALLPKKMMVAENLIEMSGFGVVSLHESEGRDSLDIKVIKNKIIDYGISIYRENSKIPFFYAGVYTAFAEVLLGIRRCSLKVIPKKKPKQASDITFSCKKC